jgi:NADH-quinone oxidoreductase subunit M
MSDNLLLSLLWAIPLAGALLVLLIPRAAAPAIRATALVATLITFGLTLYTLGVYVTGGSDIRVVAWGDGSGVPTSGKSVVILGLDDNGDLHVRSFDAGGNLVADTVPSSSAKDVSSLKQRVSGLLPAHVLTATEKNQVIDQLTPIVGHNLTGDPAPMTRSLAERAAENTVEENATSGGAGPVDKPGDLVVRRAWIPYFNVQYYLGIDGINLSLLVLTGLISLLACLASWKIDHQERGYFALFLLLVSSMMGVFLSLDLFLFFVFFEVMLLPMYFLIALWGGERREYAAIKFLLFTLFGSALVLVGLLLLYFWSGDYPARIGRIPFMAHSFDAPLLAQVAASTSYYGPAVQRWIFLLLLTGFLIKLPAFPFHTWLPDAHVEAPTPISMILAGVLLKIGGYGMVRIAWPLAPAGAYACSSWAAALGVFSILYGALAAMAQVDFKKLVAYSSISHMGFVTLGLAAMTLFSADGGSLDPRYYAYGINGAMYMMIAHGITSAGMFFLVGVIYERAHTRDLNKLGGLMAVMPIYGAVGLVIFFGAMGLPGLCGFFAEVFVILSTFNYSRWLAVLAALSAVLTAGYILWTIQRVWLGGNTGWKHLPDLSSRELAISAPLVALTVLLGVAPQVMLNWVQPSVEQVARQVASAPTVRSVFESENGLPQTTLPKPPQSSARGGLRVPDTPAK